MSTFAKSYLAPQPVSAEVLSGEAVQRMAHQTGHRARLLQPNRAGILRRSRRLSAFATFVFPMTSQPQVCFAKYGGSNLMHNQIVYNQTRSLYLHVEALNATLAITNIYAHPLIQKSEIFVGHRLVAFVGMPIRDLDHRMIGAVCSVDTKERHWGSKAIQALKRITTRIEDDWVRQHYESSTRMENTD